LKLLNVIKEEEIFVLLLTTFSLFDDFLVKLQHKMQEKLENNKVIHLCSINFW